MLDRHKQILLYLLREFDRLCNVHGFRYYACGGTAIGAVRHNGFIPWDDDIDILMPREDFQKFVQLKSSFEGTDYELFHHSADNYFLPIVKFCYRKSSYWEMPQFPCVTGVFIDVMSLDFIDGDIEEIRMKDTEFRKAFYLYGRTISFYSWSTIFHEFSQFHLKTALQQIVKKLIFRPFLRKPLYRRFLEVERKACERQGNKCISTFHSYALEKEILQWSWFEDYVLFPFEIENGGIMIRVMKGYHDFLTQLFGDYMQLPPIEERISAHDYVYMNLEKRLTVEEIKIINGSSSSKHNA